ncbi:uncharacterized protein [Euphorbia lathyris]|uniref:uncharacterized protein n=1 Tax=Euphorbia lathyris TaxID=212925 RepID=UPI0033141AA9
MLHEVFVKTHTLKKDSQTLVDDKARQVNERVVALGQQRLEEQDDSEEELDESQIFIEATTGKRKDRIYGIGLVACLYSNISDGASAPPPPVEYTPQLEQEVGELKEKYGSIQEKLTQLCQQLNNRNDEQINRNDERFKELIREMVPNLSTNQTAQCSESRPRLPPQP